MVEVLLAIWFTKEQSFYFKKDKLFYIFMVEKMRFIKSHNGKIFICSSLFVWEGGGPRPHF